jgi:parvulin-like peptidyl-prolyl isomerase
MTKKVKKRESKKRVRKQRSRLEREMRLQKLLIWGVVAVAVLVVGVVGYGFVDEKVIKARQPVAIVGGVPITTAEFQARVRYERMQAQLELERMRSLQRRLDPEALESAYLLQNIENRISELELGLPMVGTRSFEQLITEELVRQEADRRGITVAPEELQREIELYFGYDRDPASPTPVPIVTPVLTATEALTPTPTAVPLPTPTQMTEEAFRQGYNETLQALKSWGVSERQFRSWFEAGLLSQQLQEEMKGEIPATAEQVQLRFLAVESEERANELAARLDGGEDFQTLKDELDADEESTGYATDASWYTRDVLEGYFGAEWADLAFSLEIGEHSEPLEVGDPGQLPSGASSVLYYIIELSDRDEEHELPAYLHQQLADEAFQEWLDGQQDEVERKEYTHLVPAE